MLVLQVVELTMKARLLWVDTDCIVNAFELKHKRLSDGDFVTDVDYGGLGLLIKVRHKSDSLVLWYNKRQ
jgi:hypothetical protein